MTKKETNSQYIFYVIGIVFLFITIAYFSYEYILNLSNVLKTLILIALVIISFLIANIMERRDI